jgi:dephospho-CoA kinase
MKIALVGYARSGKDTVAELIKSELKSCKIVSLGDEMKKEFHKLFPSIPKDPKPRDHYETFGQSMREIDPDVWINKVKLPNERGFKNVVITDVRQLNEAEWVKDNDFYLVEVWSPLGFRVQRSEYDSEFTAVNSSEAHLHEIKCHYKLDNAGSIEDLKEKVHHMLTYFKTIEEVKNREAIASRGDEKSN